MEAYPDHRVWHDMLEPELKRPLDAVGRLGREGYMTVVAGEAGLEKLTAPSEKPRKLVPVVCACIRRRGGQEVLLGRRRAYGVPGLDGRWELPGGKIEFGERPDQALVREIREELGLEVRPLRLLPHLHTSIWEYEKAFHQVILACYECALVGGELRINKDAHEDVRWFDVDTVRLDLDLDYGSTLLSTQEFLSVALGKE